jgi:hypothetical protein
MLREYKAVDEVADAGIKKIRLWPSALVIFLKFKWNEAPDEFDRAQRD